MAKILLVEDDKSLREIYGVRLMAEGYEIVSAGDGEEALAMAIKERPDLIVSDVMMPKISGFDMLDILRSTSETKDVKVIMMTALSSDDQRARGESLGADRYLVKSQVGIEDVVRTVHDVLGDSISATPAPVEAPVSSEPTITASTETPATAPAPADEPVAQVAATPAPFDVPQPTPVAAPEPIAPAPTPSFTPPVSLSPQPEAPQVPTPPVSMPQPTPAPAAPAPSVAPAQPVAPVFEAPAPAPVTPVLPATPPSTTLSELPANPTAAPAPVASPAPLPQPTAPFSSPAPASLGDRVIQPLTTPVDNSTPDISSQIEQALNDTTPPSQNTPPTPPSA